MKKEELIKLAKELNTLDDFTGREQDLYFLKKEYIRLSNREEDTFFEKKLTEEFNKEFELLASKVGELSRSSLDDKKEIIRKANDLLSSNKDIKNLNKNINDLFNDFKHLPKCSKEDDDAMFEEFRKIKTEANNKVNAYYEGVKQGFIDRKAKKEDIIKRAKETLDMPNMKEAISAMDNLFNEWKEVGFAGKDVDDELWNEFSNVRKEFSVKRKQHFENMKIEFANRVTKKEELIKKVKYITSEAYFTDEEVKQIKDIEKEFRNIGFAGKEKDQELWDNMQAAIKKYFEEMKFYK